MILFGENVLKRKKGFYNFIILHTNKNTIFRCNVFFFFPKLKIHLNWKRNEDVEDIKRNMRLMFQTISKEEFQKYFKQQKTQWYKKDTMV